MDIENNCGLYGKAIENSKINPELHGNMKLKEDLGISAARVCLPGSQTFQNSVVYHPIMMLYLEGRLLYRGICIEDIANGFISITGSI